MKSSYKQDASANSAIMSANFFDTLRPRDPYRHVFKRILDIGLACFVAPTAIVVVLVFAMLIAIDGGNPFYFQTRLGRNGKKFRMWKLRSMVPDASRRLAEHLENDPAAAHEWHITQKLQNDPRITRIGSLIRRTSIDELPQVWNVLNGTMSMVGPRPIMENQADLYTGEGYYRLRPGITGPWQVSDRHTCEFTARVKYDDVYDREVSLTTDLRILFRTVGVVFRCTGV